MFFFWHQRGVGRFLYGNYGIKFVTLDYDQRVGGTIRSYFLYNGSRFLSWNFNGVRARAFDVLYNLYVVGGPETCFFVFPYGTVDGVNGERYVRLSFICVVGFGQFFVVYWGVTVGVGASFFGGFFRFEGREVGVFVFREVRVRGCVSFVVRCRGHFIAGGLLRGGGLCYVVRFARLRDGFVGLTSVGAVRSVLGPTNFSFGGSLNRGFLVSSDIYPRVTLTTYSGGANILRVNPNVNMLAIRLSGSTGHIITVRLSRQLGGVLPIALTSYSGIRIVFNSTVGLSLGTVVSRGFGSYSHMYIYTGLPCCVASPVVVVLLRDGLPVSGVAIVIRGRTTRHLYTRINAHRSNTVAITMDCCTMPRVLFRINHRDFLPPPGISSTMVGLGMERYPPVRLSGRGGFFTLVGTTFTRHEGAFMGAISGAARFSESRVGTMLRRLSVSPAIHDRRLDLRRLTSVSGGLGHLWGCGQFGFEVVCYRADREGVWFFLLSTF